MRTGDDSPSIDENLLKSLFTESRVPLFADPLHNNYWNYYNHVADQEKQRPKDTFPFSFQANCMCSKILKKTSYAQNTENRTQKYRSVAF